MTSWERGRENEMSGERKMQDDDLGTKVEGLGQKIAGEVEQGVDNVGDWAAGRQQDIQGNTTAADNLRSNVNAAGNDVQQWADDRANDLDRAGDNARQWAENRANDVDNAIDDADNNNRRM